MDAGPPDSGTPIDAGTSDAGTPDSGTPDSGTPCAVAVRCRAAQPLALGATLANQDTAIDGGRDCAVSASGQGGPSRYHTVTIPADAGVVIAASPDAGTFDALVRLFSTCDATMTEHSERGGMLTQGRAAVCLLPAAFERRYVVAVSRYSGEPDLNIRYDLSFVTYDINMGCPP